MATENCACLLHKHTPKSGRLSNRYASKENRIFKFKCARPKNKKTARRPAFAWNEREKRQYAEECGYIGLLPATARRGAKKRNDNEIIHAK